VASDIKFSRIVLELFTLVLSTHTHTHTHMEWKKCICVGRNW